MGLSMSSGWLLICAYLAVGFVLLARGADWLVGGGTTVARRLGISTLVVGLTVVAWGTSMPEVVVSSVAAWDGASDLSIGNVLGSNIANIGLVLGACAAVLPQVMERAMRRREVFWLFASLGVLWWVSLDAAITRGDAGVLLGVFAAHNVHLWVTARDTSELDDPGGGASTPRALTAVALGIVGISFGAWLVVEAARAGALKIGIDELVVGLTVVGVGTSLPELAAGLGGAAKGESDISLGNVVGSNVFNLLAVLGIVAMIRPLEAASAPTPESGAGLQRAFEQALASDFPAVLAFSLAAWLLPWLPGGGRTKGLFLLTGFGTYVAWRVASAT